MINPRALRPIPFVPQPPIYGTHLQTVHMTFRKDHPDVSAMNPMAIKVPMDDGSGDQLTGVIHTPAQQRYPGLLVIAGHGFGGDADSAYMRWLTKFLFENDIAVARMNLRGAGDSRSLCREDYHVGRGDDLIRLWAWLQAARPPQVPFRVEATYFAGTSMSGSILANALAKIDDSSVRGVNEVSIVLGGLGICFAFDMPATARQMHAASNWPYLQYLLGRIKILFRDHPAAPRATIEAIQAAKTISRIDDLWTAPQNGYADAYDFYADATSSKWVPHVKRPMRIVATMDDPWIPPQGFLDSDWSNPLLQPRLFSAGGHCGLWEKGFRYQRHFREILDHVESLMAKA